MCLCGSTKFKRDFLKANEELTLQGKIVLSVGFFHHSGDREVSDEEKKALDRLHFAKIDLCDWIYVINRDGYIGWSTRNEINHAINTGKRIVYRFTDEDGQPLRSQADVHA